MNKKVFIIDDDLAILEAIKIALEMEDFETKTAANCDHIIRTLKNYLPDIILLDILLSGEDGREITKKIKSEPVINHIPIVIMSAHAGAKDTIKEVGGDAFLPKPFDIEDLLDIVKNTLFSSAVKTY